MRQPLVLPSLAHHGHACSLDAIAVASQTSTPKSATRRAGANRAPASRARPGSHGWPTGTWRHGRQWGRQVRHYERTRPGARLHVEIKSSAAFPKAPDTNTTEASLRRTRMSPPNATPFNHLVGLHHCLYTTRQLHYETIAFPAASVEP